MILPVILDWMSDDELLAKAVLQQRHHHQAGNQDAV